ncbi:MAG: hypothetical protein M3137_01270 [Actinomycetota bacterium]|nr:hypothetical protein [Actinomycetota bacterium]
MLTTVVVVLMGTTFIFTLVAGFRWWRGDEPMLVLGRGYWTPKVWLVRLCQPFLEPGEQIEHLLIAYQTILEPHWTLAVTDRAILILEPGVVRPGFNRWVRNRRHARRLPRSTRLGPIHGSGWIVIGGERFFVPARRTIAAIDAEAGFPPPND